MVHYWYFPLESIIITLKKMKISPISIMQQNHDKIQNKIFIMHSSQGKSSLNFNCQSPENAVVKGQPW
jgi:hypothetical protein